MALLSNDAVRPFCKIKVFGQEVRVTQVIGTRVYLNHSVVVPGKEYTVDYCEKSDIESVDWFEFLGVEE